MIVLGVIESLWNLNATNYSFQPEDVLRRILPEETQVVDGLIVVDQTQAEEINEDGYTDSGDVGCLVEKRQIVNVCVCCIPEIEQPIDQMVNERASDVVRVLLADRTFGGQALATTRCLGTQPWLTADGGFAGFIVPLELHYRHKEIDPTFNGVD